MNGAPLETEPSSSNGDGTLSEERLFDLLGNERRRSCLQCLAVVDGVVTVQDLATDVAARVSDDDASPDDIRDSVYISLCQNHLPKLDDADVVDYDSGEKTAAPGPAFPAVERHLQVDAADESGRDPTRYYLVVSLVSVVVLGGTASAAPSLLRYGAASLIAVHALAAVGMGWSLLSRRSPSTSG